MRVGIHFRLIGGFLLLLGLATLGGVAVIHKFTAGLGMLDDVIRRSDLLAHNSEELRFAVMRRGEALRTLAVDPQDEVEQDRLRESNEAVSGYIEAIAGLVKDDEARLLLSEIETMEKQDMGPIADGVLAHARKGDVELARSTLHDVYMPLREAEEAAILALQVIGSTGRQEAYARAQSEQEKATEIATYASVVLFLLGGGLAVLLAGSVTRPVGRAAEAARQAARGDFRARLKGATRRDEIGELNRSINDMLEKLTEATRQRAEKEALKKEMSLAREVQLSMLPRSVAVPGLEVAARSVPAEDVGGDYYDVIPVADGAWIGIGDVAGHGLPAGLVMLMVQSAISAYVRENPDARPRDVLTAVNRAVYENVHHRLGGKEYVTCSLMRLYDDGRVVIAGAHEDVIVYRAERAAQVRGAGRVRTGEFGEEGSRLVAARGSPEGSAIETVATEGTWVGVVDDISDFVSDREFRLSPGDVLFLYTDGITEALGNDGSPVVGPGGSNGGGSGREEIFGFDRLASIVERAGGEAVEEIVERAVASTLTWCKSMDDDITALAVRFRGRRARGARPDDSEVASAIAQEARAG